MKKTILVICSAVLMAACNNTTNKTEKDMNKLTFNEKQASYISAIACYEAQGNLGKTTTAEAGCLRVQLLIVRHYPYKLQK